MTESDINIVIIDDNLNNTVPQPLILKLKERYSKVKEFTDPKNGTNYVINNPQEKIIVILDIMMPDMDGHQVLAKIRQNNSIIPVILYTGKDEKLHGSLRDFIENQAFSYVEKDDSYKTVLKIVENAAYQVNLLFSQVDKAIEGWIETHGDDQKEAPYIRTKDGTAYSLNDVVKSIRERTEIGQKMEQNILKLAIDLLVRDKKRLDD